jgi:hypothetical protein
MNRILAAVLVLALASPVLAQFGHKVQKARDGFTTYTLYANGHITKKGLLGGESLIDNGTGTRMIAAGGGNLYCLKNNGNIWMWQGGMSWIQADNGTGTSEIWVRSGRVYCRKNNGQVWGCIDPYRMQWQPFGASAFARAENFERLHAN